MQRKTLPRIRAILVLILAGLVVITIIGTALSGGSSKPKLQNVNQQGWCINDIALVTVKAIESKPLYQPVDCTTAIHLSGNLYVAHKTSVQGFRTDGLTWRCHVDRSIDKVGDVVCATTITRKNIVAYAATIRLMKQAGLKYAAVPKPVVQHVTHRPKPTRPQGVPANAVRTPNGSWCTPYSSGSVDFPCWTNSGKVIADGPTGTTSSVPTAPYCQLGICAANAQAWQVAYQQAKATTNCNGPNDPPQCLTNGQGCVAHCP